MSRAHSLRFQQRIDIPFAKMAVIIDTLVACSILCHGSSFRVQFFNDTYDHTINLDLAHRDAR